MTRHRDERGRFIPGPGGYITPSQAWHQDQAARDTRYQDHYPSGLAYTACGAPHSSGDPSRKCSRPVEEDGTHRGRQDVGHMNDRGNQWN